MKYWQDKTISVCAFNAHQKRVCFRIALALVFYAWGAFWPALVLAADLEYRGVSLEPLSGRYLVLKDVNVRAGPKTKTKRVGRLKAGDWVEAFGRPKDASWIAIKKDGERFGFVFAPVLVPIINGRLEKPLKGKIKETHNVTCDYVIKFTGKSNVQGEVFKTSDYEVHFKCKKKSGAFSFLAPMFITEGPYQVSRKPHYQISIDLLQVDTKKYEEHFSTIVIYQHNKKRVVFDAISVKDLGGKPSDKSRKAKSVSRALTGAVEIAASAWGPKVWQALARKPVPKKKEQP
jgi:hypothetical protein